jgi:hypothetical protein
MSAPDTAEPAENRRPAGHRLFVGLWHGITRARHHSALLRPTRSAHSAVHHPVPALPLALPSEAGSPSAHIVTPMGRPARRKQGARDRSAFILVSPSGRGVTSS